MALFSRANSNALSWLNYCFSKKFTMGTSRLKSRGRPSTLSAILQHRKDKLSAEIVQVETLKNEITWRRDQACRSLLVQVYSSKSHNDLHNYCSQFGDILSMHHYHINNRHNYILVEFKDETSIDQVLSSASFMKGDYIAPLKSSVLWFRKGQNAVMQKNNQKKMPLSVENGYSLPIEKEIATILYNAKSISAQIILLYEALKLSDLEIRLRFHTANHLEQYFSQLFHNMRVLPFGSSINGFGRKRCDLDLLLVPGDINEHTTSRLIFHTKTMKYSDRNEMKEFLGVLAHGMQHFIPGVHNIRKILEARVPIIKFRYDYTHTECDLSAINMTAIYMTELLNLYGEMDWRVRPLVTIIRAWAKSQEITSDVPGSWITNFPLTLLVLFYLQQKNILPSLKILKMYATHNDIRCAENGIDCTFLRDISKLPVSYKYKLNNDSLETLLCGFFEYYSTFDFHTNGICIREGAQIQKPSRSALHITNPLETTLNVCKNINLYELNRIIAKSHDAVYALETADNSRNDSWGIMSLLKVNNANVTNQRNSADLRTDKKEQTEEEYLEDASYESPNKFEINIDETETKKKEIV